MESKLFESQIISLVLCFLDHMNVEGWNILQRNLIGLEFPRSLNLGRFYSFSECYLNWVISRRLKFTIFYGGYFIKSTMSS
jgi:hypothetical protein